MKYVTYTGTIMKTITVEPTLKYTAAGKTYTKNMESLKVTMSSASLSLSATADSTTIKEGEAAKFKLTIKNDGNVDLKNLVVKDASGNTVSLGTSIIKEGATLTADVQDALTASKSYSFYGDMRRRIRRDLHLPIQCHGDQGGEERGCGLRQGFGH